MRAVFFVWVVPTAIIALMAEPSPGQIITPGGNPPEPPKQPAQPTQEVSVDLSQPVAPSVSVASQPQNIAPPSSVEAPLVPQPVAPTVASPETVSSPAPATTTPSVNPVTPSLSTVSLGQDGGFAPQFDLGNPASSFPGDDIPLDTSDTIAWTASEYIAHQKSSGWYGMLAVATAVFAGLVYWLTSGDFISVGVVVFAAVVFGVYAGKQPKEQEYSISPSGIGIGSKMYAYAQLKTFSITDEGAFSSITFWPLKRFMPVVTIYYDPKDEEAIVTTLSNYLPLDVEKRDVVDNFMRKIRF
jgi:hypothetical protein